MRKVLGSIPSSSMIHYDGDSFAGSGWFIFLGEKMVELAVIWGMVAALMVGCFEHSFDVGRDLSVGFLC